MPSGAVFLQLGAVHIQPVVEGTSEQAFSSNNMRPNASTTIDHSEACILSCKNSELPARGWDHHSGQGEGEGGLNVENGEAFWSGPKAFVLTGTLTRTTVTSAL